MTTPSQMTSMDVQETPRISIVRLAVAGGFTAAIAFVLCWLGTFVPFSSPTHAFISLFTAANVSSARALGEGALWSLLFGGLLGGLFGLVYNGTARLGRE